MLDKSVTGKSEFARDRANTNPGYLSAEETVEIARIQSDESIIGYAILKPNGEEIDSGGAWKDMLAPIFANIFYLADRLGGDFGESENCPMLMMEGPDFEVAGCMLSSARVVFIRQKRKQARDVLRLVS